MPLCAKDLLDKSENMEEYFSNLALKFGNYFKNKIDSFIKLPIILKIFIAPIVFIIFIIFIIPPVLFFGSLYKVFIVSYRGVVKFIYSWRNLVFGLETILIFLLLLVPILLLWLILCTIFITIILQLPTFMLNIVLFVFSPYLLIVLFKKDNDILSKITDFIKDSRKENYTYKDIENLRDTIINNFGKHAKLHPFYLMLKGPFILIFMSAFNFCGGISILLILVSIVNKIFPNVFFIILQPSVNQIAIWIGLLFNEILKVIPIKLFAPFIKEFSLVQVSQPLGGLFLILIETFIAYQLYMLFSSLYVGYTFKKIIRTT